MDLFAVQASHIGIAAIGAAIIAIVTLQRSLLDRGGAIAATLLGPALVATGGWWLGALLIAFFLTSSLLPQPAGVKPSRTWTQVLANGGPALAFSSFSMLVAQPELLIAAATSIAAATADTWATEIGRRFGGPPVSLRTGRHVPPGTSGAVSAIGTAATVTGATLMASLAVLIDGLAPDQLAFGFEAAVVIAIGSTFGSFVDSVLGATIQARFTCDICEEPAESRRDHRPDHAMRLQSGVSWLTNDGVNTVAAIAAGGFSIVLAIFFL